MLPTWYGYLAQRPPQKIFMGFRFMAEDHNSYATFVNESAEEGKLFFENRYTTEPQKGRFLLLYMWLVGKISRITGLGVVGSWELARLVSGFVFMLVTWCFASLLFDDLRKRFLAYMFVAFSGGIGWLVYPLMMHWIRGMNDGVLKDPFNLQWNWSTFGSMTTPLWVAPAALLLFCAYLIGGPRRKLRQSLGIILPPLIWFMHPYTGISAYATFLLFPLVPVFRSAWHLERVSWQPVRERLATVWPMLVSVVIVLVYIVWARQDQVYALSAQRVFSWTPTYSLFLYPFAYGLVLVLALFGIKWGDSLPAHARDILLAWLVASTILSLNPFLAGVKFQYLVHMPMAFLAANGLLELRCRSPWVKNFLKGGGAVLVGTLLFLNSALLVVKDYPSTWRDATIFLSQPEIDAMKFLKDQSPGNVLSSASAGNRIAWLAAKKVYVGHWFLTIDYDRKVWEVHEFFDQQKSVDEKREWLASRQIRYIYYGPTERSQGGVDPGLGLAPIYAQNGVTIYAVP